MSLAVPPNMLDLESIEAGDNEAAANSVKVLADVLNQLAARPNKFRVDVTGGGSGVVTEDGNVFLGTFNSAAIAPASGMRAKIPGRAEAWIFGSSYVDNLSQAIIYNLEDDELVWSTIDEPTSDSYDYLVGPPNGRSFTIALGSRADADYRWDLVAGDDVYAENGFFERGRTPAVGAWTTYTPTWTGTGSNPAIGDGTLTGRYSQVGNTVAFSVLMTAGSTTTFGAGDWRFALPFTANAATPVIGTAVYIDSSGGPDYYGGQYGGITTSTVAGFLVGAVMTQVDGASPFAWGSGDILAMTGVYERV